MLHKKNPYIDVLMANRRDFVEIGGIKWATCNVGAENPWEAGLYFQWGDTRGYSQEEILEKRHCFSALNYKFASDSVLTKYNNEDMCYRLELEDDAVKAAWGGNWRTPSLYDYKCLHESTSRLWVDDYNKTGVPGCIFTDKSDVKNHIFFPAQGYAFGPSVVSKTFTGHYWLSSLDSTNMNLGYCIFISKTITHLSDNYRTDGFTIRGILI